MKRFPPWAVLGVCGAGLMLGAARGTDAEEGWISLFNGRDLTG